MGGSPSAMSARSSARSVKPKPLHQPRNRTHTSQEEINIRRRNIGLLTNLERIQRKGGGTDSRPRKVAIKHVAAAQINRSQAQRKVVNQNTAFLKRLNGVKSTMGSHSAKGSIRRPRAGGGGGGGSGGRPGVGAGRGGGGSGSGGSGSPHTRQTHQVKQRKAKRPEWVDLPVGPESHR
jgi:uncharacterized membrane protein YgcG